MRRLKIFFAFALLLAAASPHNLLAQEIIPTKGKEFWLGFLLNFELNNGASQEIFIASETNTTGLIEIPGQGYSQAFTVTADEPTSILLPENLVVTAGNQNIENRGIYIETEDTVAVFALNFLAFTSDATKVLPTQSIGTSYRINSYPGVGAYGSEFLIVATEDDTEVVITPSQDLPNGEVAGVPFSVFMNRGETYQVRSSNEIDDFTGTLIETTEESGPCRPIAIFSGTVCAYIPAECQACDHIMDQPLPLNTWGNEFFVIPFSFTTQYTLRILANEDNTAISSSLGDITLNAGEFIEYNDLNEPLCITSSAGISVTQYMEGVTCSGSGDPAMCTLNDAGQMIDNITFTTIESAIITDHAINVIMDTEDLGTLTLDGALVDPDLFDIIPDCPQNSFAQIEITEGVHTLDSPEGFTAYVYGAGEAESYFYSVGSFSSDPIEIENVTCTNDTVLLNSSNALTNIQWYAQSNPEIILGTGPTLILVPPIISDIYVAIGNQFLSGCPEEEFFSVEVPDPPGLILSQSATEVCQFQSVQLGVETIPASGGYNYLWSPADGLDDPTSPNPIATPLETTTYSVYVYTNTECGTNTDSLTITVLPGGISSFEILADDMAICEGDEIELNLDFEEPVFFENFDPINNSLWDQVDLGSESDNCGSVTGNALWFNGTGTRQAATQALDLSQGGTINFNLKIGAGSFPCDNADPGEGVVLEYSTGGAWTIIQSYSQAGFANFTDLTEEIPVGAQTSATSIRWRQVANSGNNEDNWALDNIYISINTAISDFTWSPDYNISAIDQVNVVVNPLTDTTYYVSYSDPNTGCAYIDSVDIEVDLPFTVAMSNDTTICAGESAQLFASPNEPGSYFWSWSGQGLSNFSIENPSAAPSITETINVTVSTGMGCEVQDSVLISVINVADITIFGGFGAICPGESTQLFASVAGTFNEENLQWSPAEGLSDPNSLNPIASPEVTTVYTLTISGEDGVCAVSESIEIVVEPAFTIDAGPDLVLCTVEGTQLTVNTNYPDPNNLFWNWNNFAVLSNPFVQNPVITANGSYSLTVTAQTPAGCFEQDEINIQLLYESIDLGGPYEICDLDTLFLGLDNDSDFSFSWNTGQTSSEISATESGEYTVTVSSSEGCEFTDTAILTVNPLPIIDFGPIPLLCVGDALTLNAGNPGSSYNWSTGSNNQSITVTTDNFYEVEVVNQFQCSSSSSVDLEFVPVPVLELEPFYRICQGEIITLNAGSSIYAYQWSNGQSTSSISTGTEGIYSVIATNSSGCISERTTTLAVEPLPIVDLGPDQYLCLGERADFDAGNDDYAYLWSNGDTTRTSFTIRTGMLLLEASTEYCNYKDSVFVSFDQPPVNYLPEEISFCFEDCPYNLIIDAGNMGSEFLWDNDSTGQSLTVVEEGLYTVTITSPLGCERTFSTDIIEFCRGGNVFIPNAFTPNADGINDLFKVVAPEGIDEFEIRIFNRFGEMVWTTTDPREGWNGSNQGDSFYGQAEVYVYTVKYKFYTDCEGISFDIYEGNGHITLVR